MVRKMLNMYPAKVYRAQARAALSGKWKSALLVLAVISLFSGAVFGVSVSTEVDGSAPDYYILNIALGPLRSQSLWQNGQLVQDAAKLTKQVGILPYSLPLLLITLVVVLLLMVLQPVCRLGIIRLGLDIADDKVPSLSVLRISWRQYWRMVGVEIRSFLAAAWPFFLLVIAAAVLMIVFQTMDEVLFVLLVVAAFVLLCIRMLNYWLAAYLMIERPEASIRALLGESRRLMKNCRVRVVLLELSFIGWFAFYCVVNIVLSSYILPLLPSFSLQVAVSVFTALLALPLSLYAIVSFAMFFRDRVLRDAKKLAE